MIGRFILAITIVALCSATATALIDPHDEEDAERCSSCHTEGITDQPCTEEHGYCLFGDSVDDTCLICHKAEDCCQLGQEHQGASGLGHSHPSGMDIDEVPKIHRPNTLPLHEGRITCNTCHRHNRKEPVDYMLVRMVKITDSAIDWTALCADCHTDY